MTRAGLLNIVNALGQPAIHATAVDPRVFTSIAKCLTQSTSKAPEMIVQAYGVNGREFVFMNTAVPSAPLKFDEIQIGTERYVLDVAIPLHEEGTGDLMGWRCYAKGK